MEAEQATGYGRRAHMLAEEAAAALRRLGAARTPMSSDPGKRRRARSPSSSSESGSDERGSGKRGKGQVAGKGECVGPDVAEALHRGKAFCEEADDSISKGGRVGEAMASVPAELKGLLRRALVSDKVSNKGEHKTARKVVPAFVERARDALERELRRAMELHVKEDMSGRSELGRRTAEKLAQDVRRLNININRVAEAVRAARGSRAPPQGSILELQDVWGLIRAALSTLDSAVPVGGRALEQVAGQISTGAAAAGVTAAKCKEWMGKVLTTLAVDASDWRMDAAAPLPTLTTSVQARAEWLKQEVSDARTEAVATRGGERSVSEQDDWLRRAAAAVRALEAGRQAERVEGRVWSAELMPSWARGCVETGWVC